MAALGFMSPPAQFNDLSWNLWCREWDTNPRTHLGPDLKPGAFDHLSHPCDLPKSRHHLNYTPNFWLRLQPPSTLITCPEM